VYRESVEQNKRVLVEAKNKEPHGVREMVETGLIDKDALPASDSVTAAIMEFTVTII
jgi:hypothetical protein